MYGVVVYVGIEISINNIARNMTLHSNQTEFDADICPAICGIAASIFSNLWIDQKTNIILKNRETIP